MDTRLAVYHNPEERTIKLAAAQSLRNRALCETKSAVRELLIDSAKLLERQAEEIKSATL